VRPGVEEQLSSFRQGGTGTRSEEDVQPETLPDKFESGNHNAPGLVGLEAGAAWLLDRGVSAIHDHERALIRQLIDGFSGIHGVRIFGPSISQERVGVVSLAIEGFDPQDVANILDQSFGIQTRAGLHCAPGAHRAIGSFDAGGTVRFSVGPFTTDDHIAAAIDAVRQIAGVS
jgi:selenocysteine lyase/cysteine desulfurase